MPASFLVGDRIKVDSSSLLGLNDDLSLYAALRIMPRGPAGGRRRAQDPWISSLPCAA
jgi:hypothetical protein